MAPKPGIGERPEAEEERHCRFRVLLLRERYLAAVAQDLSQEVLAHMEAELDRTWDEL